MKYESTIDPWNPIEDATRGGPDGPPCGGSRPVPLAADVQHVYLCDVKEADWNVRLRSASDAHRMVAGDRDA